MRVLITGSNGLLGQKLVHKLRIDELVELIATSKGENRISEKIGYIYISLDVTKKEELDKVILSENPDVIINQPNSAILSVGAIEQKPVVKEGQIVVGNTMKVTLACDHRTVDGATGAQFLQTVRAYIENPVTMLA